MNILRWLTDSFRPAQTALGTPESVELPTISALKARCQALATLDLILSPEWENRCYSFNARWAPGQQMASMRNGSGDEWFCLFDSAGWAGLKGLDHESKAWSKGRSRFAANLRAHIPTSLAQFSNEPAFIWDMTSFAFYSLSEGATWVNAASETSYAQLQSGTDWLLELLIAPPSAYVRYATDCFERAVDEQLVAAIYAHQPITDEMVAALNHDVTLEAIASDLFSNIGYPEKP